MEGGVAELHGFKNDIFHGATGRNHGKNVLGIRNHDVENVGGFRGKHALECRADLLRLCDALGRNPEALADRKVIRKDCCRGFGITQEGVTAVAGEEAVLPLNDHTEVLVVNDDGFGRDIFRNCGG